MGPGLQREIVGGCREVKGVLGPVRKALERTERLIDHTVRKLYGRMEEGIAGGEGTARG
jgi:hypothetical protein